MTPTITTLQSRIRELEEALRPFAEVVSHLDPRKGDSMVIGAWGGTGPFVVVNDFRRAARVLEN